MRQQKAMAASARVALIGLLIGCILAVLFISGCGSPAQDAVVDAFRKEQAFREINGDTLVVRISSGCSCTMYAATVDIEMPTGVSVEKTGDEILNLTGAGDLSIGSEIDGRLRLITISLSGFSDGVVFKVKVSGHADALPILSAQVIGYDYNTLPATVTARIE